MRKMWSLIAIVGAVVAVVGAAGNDAWAQSSGKKLIELGWDIPNTAYIRANISQMEQSPFDGTIFFVHYTRPDGKTGNLSREVWGQTLLSESAMQPAIDDLKATRFRKFTDNFLRVNMTPGDLDWFDDYSSVIKNMRLAARVAHEGGVKGIFLDTEQYAGRTGFLFTYDRQRNRSTKSLDNYNAQARKRAREVMAAIQEEYPGLTLFLSFSRSYAIVTKGKKTPSSGIRYDLLPAFVDGLVDGANGNTRIVDGFEASYSYRDPAQFDAAYAIIKDKAAKAAADPGKYRKYVSAGFGIWLDTDWEKRGWDTTSTTANYYQPDDIRSIVRKALDVSDRYVWIYSQKPNWWKKQNVPSAYINALTAAKQDAQSDR